MVVRHALGDAEQPVGIFRGDLDRRYKFKFNIVLTVLEVMGMDE